MASQLVSLAGFRQPTTGKLMPSASYGETGSNLSLSQLPISHFQRIENQKSFEGGSSVQSKPAKGEKPTKGKIRGQSRRGDEKRVLHRIGLWLLKKAKVMYHRFCFDALDHPRMEVEVSLVDAYFSIPVVPTTTTAPPYVV